MNHSRPISPSDTSRRSDNLTFIPQILLGGHDDATSSSIDLSQTLAAESGLGVEHDSIPPPPSEHIRRRSELRQKPAHKGEDLELTVLPSVPEDCHASAARPKSCDTEIAPRSLNASQVSSVRVGDDFNSTTPVVSENQNAEQRWKGRFHFAALCYFLFLEGWNDGSTGPLLPTIQRYHNVGFAIVSLLFVFNCVGFLSGAMMNVYLDERLGFGKVILLGAVLQLGAYVMLSPGGPFALMCAAFCISGFGIALQNSQANGFVGSLKDAHAKYSFLHGAYGLGAFVAPLVATNFANQGRWYFHYLISAGLGIINTAIITYVFRLKKQDDIMAEAGHAAGEVDNTKENKYKQILGIRTVHLLSVFALIYVGVEVTLGGWIVTFIQQKRGGGPSAGYISSGFFGGLMLGRLVLIWLNRKVGERRIMFIYALLAIILEITIWVVPSLLENALSFSCIGFLLGPMMPILMTYCTQILPKWLLTGCVGWIGGMGQAGSAILPFTTGLLASRFGIGSLQPFVVSMMSTLVVLWAFVPRVRRVD